MKIQYALDTIQQGGFCRRLGWPNQTYIFMFGDVIMLNQLGIDSVWVPSHLDLFATDWMEQVTPNR